MNTKDEVLNAISNHIFCWPFKFETGSTKNRASRRGEFVRNIEDAGWCLKNMKYSNYLRKGLPDQQELDVYRLEQYLSISARDIFIEKQDGNVRAIKNETPLCAVYQYPLEDEFLIYQLELENDKKFYLPIADIELHLYHHEVGILFIQVLNYAYDSIDDVKLINDQGRRISIPFIPKQVDEKGRLGFMLCAEKIGIMRLRLENQGENLGFPEYLCEVYNNLKDQKCKKMEIDVQARDIDKKTIYGVWKWHLSNIDNFLDSINMTTDFRGSVNDYYNASGARAANIDLNVDLSCQTEFKKVDDAAHFLYGILAGTLGSEKQTPENLSEQRNARIQYFRRTVTQCADDRMFTISVIRNNVLSARIKAVWKNDDLGDDDLQNDFYSVIYVDRTGSSCLNRSMRMEQLKQAVYPRWSGYGTIHAVTNYSMCCITATDEGINDDVVRPVIALYTYMISLVLAQRMGIENFSEEAGTVATKVGYVGSITREQTRALVRLQEKYIMFKNQILILEASSQEQGMELYHLMQKQLLVKDYQAILDEQLQSLYEAATSSSDNKIAIWGLFIAVLAIIVPEITPVIFDRESSMYFLLIKITVSMVFIAMFYNFDRIRIWFERIRSKQDR